MSLCRSLVTEDYVVQSMPEVSPTKWHLAHTSWFFETFILKPYAENYREFDPNFGYLFNSYYNAIGDRHCRQNRGQLSRPTVEDVYAYRAHIDCAMHKLFANCTADRIASLVDLGMQHEQQHQELMLTDIKHVFWVNPLRPAYRPPLLRKPHQLPGLDWMAIAGGLREIGHDGKGFAFDNEGPRHSEYVPSFRLGSRLVTNGEFKQFIDAGGYQRSEFWLSLGWTTVEAEKWNSPLYWIEVEGEWLNHTLGGLRPVLDDEPVCHVSFFEADAFARWAGARLPTEAEWETASTSLDPQRGSFAESEAFHPRESESVTALQQMFGELWQWTGSAYLPYTGYAPPPGALGEYNAKFMCNQFVLRGGSIATPRTHIRRTYRNFFPPATRWQFSGIRLAQNI